MTDKNGIARHDVGTWQCRSGRYHNVSRHDVARGSVEVGVTITLHDMM